MLDEITLKPNDAVTIGIAQTSKDIRLRHYVVHTIFGGELYRVGAISAVLPGRQTIERAWYYGLRMLAHYVGLQTPARAHLVSGKASQAWAQGKHYDSFYDLAQLVSWDQRQRIRVNQQQIRSVPNTGLSLRNRYKDANRASMEVALSLQPHDFHDLEQENKICGTSSMLPWRRTEYGSSSKPKTTFYTARKQWQGDAPKSERREKVPLPRTRRRSSMGAKGQRLAVPTLQETGASTNADGAATASQR